MSEPHTQVPRDTPPIPVPRSLRIGSFLLSSLLTVLVVWLLGFVLNDIGNIDGPNYPSVANEFIDGSLRQRSQELRSEIGAIETRIARQQELQVDQQRSMDNARETMQQMMELHRLSLEQQAPPTETEKEALASAQQRFLRAQEQFEVANAEIASSNETKFRLRQELELVAAQTNEQEQPARLEFDKRQRAHLFRVASLKLALIVPLFLIAAWLFARYRKGAYQPILMALLFATSWMLGRVMFDHFPREFFKYIAIAAAIAIVLWFLVWMLNKAVKPNRSLLLDRYREAYRGHVCPVCAFPIARGPLRFALWTRKGPRMGATNEATHGIGGREAHADTPYACPSCGTMLFSSCRVCEAPRHTLLPYCERCGDELVTDAGTEPQPVVPGS